LQSNREHDILARRLTLYIIIAMILGIATGYALHQSFPADSPTLASAAQTLKLLPDVFLRADQDDHRAADPGHADRGHRGHGRQRALGRIGGRALGWFITASLISISLGLLLVNLFRRATACNLPPVAKSARWPRPISPCTTSCSRSCRPACLMPWRRTTLQILVFSLFAGLALSAIGEKGAPLLRGAEAWPA
jgi:Na+/H+-dicarboxylate symporter